MTVTEALNIVNRTAPSSPAFETFLVCGFTPLHLQVFLAAYLQKRLPERHVAITTGLFGDLAGSLEGLERSDAHAVACVLEWPDLDRRLGYRETGEWSIAAESDFPGTVQDALDRIWRAIERIPAGVRVAVSLPTLPFPPVFHTPGWQASAAETTIDRSLAGFGALLSGRPGTALVNARRLAEDSPAAQRLNLKSDLSVGLPYAMPHADALASALTRLLVPDEPKKGIISDLDDTLWHGLVGEIGAENVSWDLAHHQPAHGLYQRLLSSLTDAGVLVAIASKNDPAVAAEALARKDLLLRTERVFPIEVHWEPKSQSVGRILDAWNISADSVILVDDSPMELAEAAAVFPELTCVQFPQKNPESVLRMLRSLRDLCGKETISFDDLLRPESIRRGVEFQSQARGGAGPENFLKDVHATLTLDFDAGSEDARALDLVNKTNQFNINGLRYTSADWKKNLSRPGSVLLVAGYEDKFGPLGRIAVLQGRVERGALTVETWVMSCRAFARRVEYQCLRSLFERHHVDELTVQFAPTSKNGPAQDFFASFCGEKPIAAFRLTRAQFDEKCPALYHHVFEIERAEANG